MIRRTPPKDAPQPPPERRRSPIGRFRRSGYPQTTCGDSAELEPWLGHESGTPPRPPQRQPRLALPRSHSVGITPGGQASRPGPSPRRGATASEPKKQAWHREHLGRVASSHPKTKPAPIAGGGLGTSSRSTGRREPIDQLKLHSGLLGHATAKGRSTDQTSTREEGRSRNGNRIRRVVET